LVLSRRNMSLNISQLLYVAEFYVLDGEPSLCFCRLVRQI
jgi:hypothetical protein